MANGCLGRTHLTLYVLVSLFLKEGRPDLMGLPHLQATHFPKDSYSSLKYLLGMPTNADVISYYTSFAAPNVASSTRFTTSIRRGSSMARDSGVMPATLDVEELVAMQLAYVHSLAVDVAGAGKLVQDVVVTVPAFFSQFERNAIADAVELAGLRLLAFVNDGTAVAVNYAMMRQFPKPEHHIVYDASAASMRATVVTFTGQGKKQDTRLRLAHSHLQARCPLPSCRILSLMLCPHLNHKGAHRGRLGCREREWRIRGTCATTRGEAVADAAVVRGS